MSMPRNPACGSVCGSMLAVAMAAMACIASVHADTPTALYSPDLDLTDASYVRGLARMTDGSVVVAGGLISRVNDQSRRYLARIQSNGSLHGWAPEPNAAASAAWVDASGRLYVGGTFTNIAGQARNRMARFDADGNLDPAFAPSVTDGGINAITAGLPGEVCFGGSFTQVNGEARGRLACVSDQDGSLNASWNPGANNTVSVMVSDPSGLYVGGSFTQIAGITRKFAARIALAGSGTADAWNPDPSDNVTTILPQGAFVYLGGGMAQFGGITRPGVAKVNASTGALVTTWNAQVNFPDLILSLAPDGSGGIVVAGAISSLGGQPRRGIARLDGTTGNAVPGWNPGVDYGYPTRILAEPGGYILAGTYSSIDAGAHIGLARVLSDGEVDPGFNPSVEGPGYAYRIVRNPVDGALYVAGRFVRANGLIRRNLLKLRRPGLIDPNWAPSFDSEVRALALDDLGRLYAGGYFEWANGQSRPYLVRLLNTLDGALDNSWNAQPNGGVFGILLRNEGVYVQGGFSQVSGSARQGLARLSPISANPDLAWVPTLTGSVIAMEEIGNQLLIGGSFTSVGGAPHAGLAKLSTGVNAVVDAAWVPTVTGAVYTLAVDGDRVYVGGDFTAINGSPRTRLARLDGQGSGTLDSDWLPSVNNLTGKILPTPQGVYLAGYFSSVNGQGQGYLARVDETTGALDPRWQSGANSWVLDMLSWGKCVYPVGWFSAIGTQVRQGVARLPVAGDTIFLDDIDG